MSRLKMATTAKSSIHPFSKLLVQCGYSVIKYFHLTTGAHLSTGVC